MDYNNTHAVHKDTGNNSEGHLVEPKWKEMVRKMDRNLESGAGRMCCGVSRSLPPPTHSHPAPEMHEVNRKGIREVESDFLCENFVFFHLRLGKSWKRLEGKISLRTHTMVGLCLGGLLPELDVERVAGWWGSVCTWWSCVLENLRRRQSFSKSRTAEIFLVALHEK